MRRRTSCRRTLLLPLGQKTNDRIACAGNRGILQPAGEVLVWIDCLDDSRGYVQHSLLEGSMKIYPVIGSKYTGEPLDRPCLRQLPRGWVLEETEEHGDTAVMLACALAAVFAAVSVWLDW